MPPCLTFSIVKYISRVKWSDPGKGVAPPQHLGEVASGKEVFSLPLTMVTNFTYIYVCVCVCLYICVCVYIYTCHKLWFSTMPLIFLNSLLLFFYLKKYFYDFLTKFTITEKLNVFTTNKHHSFNVYLNISEDHL